MTHHLRWRAADLARGALLGCLVLALGGACVRGGSPAPAAASVALIGNFRGFQKPCG